MVWVRQPVTEAEPQGKGVELQLLDGVLRGEPGAERAFVERFVPIIRACVRRLSRGSRVTDQDLEDMVGEVWLCLFEDDKRRLRRFDPGREVRVSTWIGALARNRSIDYLRALQPSAATASDDELIDEAPLPPETLEQRERVELVRQAVAQLPPTERDFLRELCIDEREARAIAEKLGIALATVYSKRFKLAAKLAREVERLADQRCLLDLRLAQGET